MQMSSKVSHDSETPAHGQQVLTASAFIHHDFAGVPKVFLPRRALSKKFFPGVYEMPGGHIDFGEEMADGLAREIQEELAMTITVGDPFFEFTYLNDVKGSHSLEVVYFAKFVEPISQITIQPEDHADFGWFTAGEIDAAMAVGRQPGDDMEARAVKKGFALLSGQKLNFG